MAAPSRLAQSLGLSLVLYQDSENGRSRRGLRKNPARARCSWHGLGMAHRAMARFPVDAAALAAGSLLRVCHRLRICANLHSRMVASLLVQHALRSRTAPRLCAWPGVRRIFLPRCRARVQAGLEKVCDEPQAK